MSKIRITQLARFAEDILRVTEDGQIDEDDFFDIQKKFIDGLYKIDYPELATYAAGMCLLSGFYNDLSKRAETIQEGPIQ